MDFADFFTYGARELVPLAWKKGLLFLFDVRGPSVFVVSDTRPMHETLHRLSMSALELLDDGFIFMSAQTEMHDDRTADLSVSIAGTGTRAADEQVREVLRRLGMRERAPAPDGTTAQDNARIATGRCAATGAILSFAANRSDGLLFAFDLNVPARLIELATPSPHAEGARAWLVADKPLTYQSLVRRLQRLGWATTTFTSVQQTADHLAQLKTGMTRPSLVVGAESPRVTAEQMRLLRTLLPARTQLVLAAAIDSRTRTAGFGIEMRHWPFSPRELDEFTRRALGAPGPFSGETMPAPLTFTDRPIALVVDDNAVNLLVASGLLQVAGFEVDTAAGGAEAIARCRERAPQLVLMDLHMPQMDGLETTRALRELQRRGVLPHFTILAATADAVEMGEPACEEAGMDGYLSKPLSLQAIQRELQRVQPALARLRAAD
jgi:CheY-like chemotaxis protein